MPLPESMLTYLFSGIHLRAILQEVLMNLIHNICSEITLLLTHLPGADELTHWGRDNMAAISQKTLSNAFSWMKIFEFRLKFHS